MVNNNNQMYLYNHWQVTEQEMNAEINNLGDNFASPELLVKVDYFYHHQDNNYDGGLSMLDRIYAKLGQFHPEWNIQNMKDNVRNANNSQEEFILTIRNMFQSLNDIAYYGL